MVDAQNGSSSAAARQREEPAPPEAPQGDEAEQQDGCADDGSAEEGREDGLVLAEHLEESLGTLRDRSRAAERFFKRLSDLEHASAKSQRRGLSKAIPADAGVSSAAGRALQGPERMQRLLVRVRALLELRASQGESLAGVWDSEQRRWAGRSASAQEAKRRVDEETRPKARELCAAQKTAERLQRKHTICRASAVQALRTRGPVEEVPATFTTACASSSRAELERQKQAKRAESAFRDYVLTKQALSKHSPALRHAEEQHRVQLRAMLALSREAHTSFCQDLKESLQLAIGSLHVFSNSLVEAHGELKGGGRSSLDGLGSPCGGAAAAEGPAELLRASSEATPDSPDAPAATPLALDLPSPCLASDMDSSLRGRGGQAAAAPKAGSPGCSPSATSLWETTEASEALSARLDGDRVALRGLQALMVWLREAQDQELRSLALVSFPAPGAGEHERFAEAASWVRGTLQARMEAAGAVGVYLVEHFLPALEQQLAEVKNDMQLIQDEQKRTAASITQASRARLQKVTEVPMLGPAFTNEDSELIFCSRMMRILEEVRQRCALRAAALARQIEELLGVERARWHLRTLDSGSHVLRRLASAAIGASVGPPWMLRASTSAAPALGGSPQRTSEVGEASTLAEEALLVTEEKRVKAKARALADFSGREGFAFQTGDEVKLLLKVGDPWLGIDPRGVTGEFPPHLVEVEGNRGMADGAAPDLVALFKKDVLENEDYVPSAEDEEFASRFAEYLGCSSKPETRVLASYPCALVTSRKVPLQGRLYMTAQYLGFFSHFSDSAALVENTVLLIRLTELARLEKRANALIFQNSIEVFLVDGASHFFASFEQRDGAFDYLTKLRDVRERARSQEVEDAGTSTHGGSCSSTSSPGIAGGKSAQGRAAVGSARQGPSAQKQSFRATACAAYPACAEEAGSKPWTPLKYELPGRVYTCGLEVFFDAVFRDFGPESLWAAYEADRSARPVETPAWAPMPAVGAASKRLSEGTSGTAESDRSDLPRRQAKLQRPVQAAAWMRRFAAVGEWCDCTESMTLYGLDQGKAFVVQTEIEVSGVPFSEYFIVRSRYRATNLGEGRTQLDAEVEVDFKRSTMLQSRIEQQSLEEFRKGFEAHLLPMVTRRVHADGGFAPAEQASRDAAKDQMDGSAVVPSTRTEVLRRCREAMSSLPALLPSASQHWQVILICLVATSCILLLATLRALLRIEAQLERALAAGSAGVAVPSACPALMG